MAKLRADSIGRFAVTRLFPVALLGYALAHPGFSQSPQIDYQRQVEPIFKARCSPCHFGGQTAGGLALDSFASFAKGGSSGAMAIPGKPDESEILNRILGKGGKPRMPMGFKALADAETSVIRDWITQGAKDSKEAAPKHWAYVAPIKAPLPEIADKVWAVNPVDRFVRARLDHEELTPSASADKTTLIRRVTLDLTGLAPTPEEVDAFLADESTDAFEKVVDRLLASPHFGERMALPWLDAARYADSNGFQQDGDTFQYIWRDWVVNAFNADMPYDQFTIEQLAGDLLPNPTLEQLIATAFNRNHMLNGEGGAIPEEQRSVVLFDRVDATSTTWLGLTMACARCHDHKYDPISQRDFYAMMAYFNNVPETGVPAGTPQYRYADPVVVAGTPDQLALRAERTQKVNQMVEKRKQLLDSAAIQNAFKAWKQRFRDDEARARAANVKFSPWLEAGVFAGDPPQVALGKEYGPETKIPKNAKERSDLTDGAVHRLDGENTTFYFAREINSASDAPYLFSVGSDDAMQLILNGRTVLSFTGARAATPDSHFIPVTIPKGQSTLIFKVMNGGGIGGFYFKAHPGSLRPAVMAQLDSTKPEDVKAILDLFAETAGIPELEQLNTSIEGAAKSLTELESVLPRVMVMSDAMPRKTHIFSRGNYEEPLEEVPPAAPRMLPGEGGENRLALARWLTSDQNPLTARVQVNRIWQMFFGTGLVKTPENFGVQGEAPSHPELLDWLAVDFRENGWQMKRLVRMIVTSRTYQQTSRMTKDLQTRDPENRLLARGPRFRLPSMILRDVALSTSGILDPKVGGRPVYPYQPKGIWDSLAITLERDFTYPQGVGADNHRRSIYTFWRRTVAPGNMFDASSRQICTVRPSLTSTPLHSLTMLNDITWVEAGRALAQNVMSLPDRDERLIEAFRRVCARRPDAAELSLLNRALDRSLAAFRADPKAADAYLNQGEFPVDKSRDPVELAAYASVCLAIYNLDEAMTKE